MTLGSLSRDGWRSLLFRLGGSGYSQDEDSNVYKERDAWAWIAERASASLEAAHANSFLSTASALLNEIEAVRFLTQGSTRLDSVRQSRLLAFLRALPMVPARVAYGFATHVGATSGSTLQPTLAQLQAHRASPLGALFVGRREPDAAHELIRRDLFPIMQRGLPARMIPGQISVSDAVWGDELEDALAPASIKLDPAVTIATQTKARVAPLEVYPGRCVTRDEWIELQSQLCWKSHGFSIDQEAQGRTIFVGATLSSGGTSIDHSVDWSNRIVQAWGAVGVTDDDPTPLGLDANGWLPPSKMGPAGSGYTHTLYDTQVSAVSLDITFSVNGSGDLVITNTSGGTIDVRLLVRGSPMYAPGSTTDTQPWIDSERMQHDDVAELYASTLISDVDDGGQFAGTDAGAIRRVLYTGALLREAGGGVSQSAVLDTSEDWRHRWVLVAPLQSYQGLTSDPENHHLRIGSSGTFTHSSTRSAAPRLFFTGAGQALGSASVLANQALCGELGEAPKANAWVFARNTDGALVIEMKDISTNQCYEGLLMLVATEQTTGDSVVTPVPVHATQVQTLDVEQPQNTGCFAQGRQGGVPRYLLSDPVPKTRPTCPAMGIISEGNSPVRPVKWERREMLGARDDGTWEYRQPIVGQRKRLVSIACPANSQTPVDDFNLPAEMVPGINDQVDFRDRFLWVEGRSSTTNITIGNASQQSDVSSNPFVVLMYTGPGGDIFLPFAIGGVTGVLLKFEFTRNYANGGYHSRLLVNNTTGSTVYVNATIEVSGFLGFTDRRAMGAP
jgi:hypothetical protein